MTAPRLPTTVLLSMALSLAVACGSTVRPTTDLAGDTGSVTSATGMGDQSVSGDTPGDAGPTMGGVAASAPSAETGAQGGRTGTRPDASTSTSGTGGSTTSAGPPGAGPVTTGAAGSPSGGAARPNTPASDDQTSPAAGQPSTSGATNGRGVTDDTIKIGFVIAAGNPGAAFGVELANDGDANRQILEALVADLNDHGGIGGRQVEPVYVFNDTTRQDEATQLRQQTELCVNLTEDEQVYLAISLSTNGLHYAYDCFAAHETTLIEGSLIGADHQRFDELSPWLITPVYMNFTRMARLLPAVLERRGFLTDKIGVFTYDDPGLARSMDVLVGELERRGGTVLQTASFARTYEGLGSGVANAVLQFSALGIDRVISWAPEGGALLIFTTQAESQGYRPTYGVTTYDAPRLVAETAPATQLSGATGVSFLTGRDLPVEHSPPLYDREQDCFEVVADRTGNQYANRRDGGGAASFALAACTLLWFVDDTLDPAAGQPLQPSSVADHAVALPDDYVPVMAAGASFTPDRLDGINQYADLVYDDGCGCFQHGSPWQPIDG